MSQSHEEQSKRVDELNIQARRTEEVRPPRSVYSQSLTVHVGGHEHRTEFELSDMHGDAPETVWVRVSCILLSLLY